MCKRKMAVVAMLFLGHAAVVNAETWRLISAADGLRIYIDDDSLLPSANRVRTKFEQKTCDMGKVLTPCDLIREHRIDCKERYITTERVKVITHQDGEVVMTDSGPIELSPRKVRGGTVFDSVLVEACERH